MKQQRMSVAEYRVLVGAGPVSPAPSFTHAAQPAPVGKRHHALGRLAPGEMNKTEARYEREVLAPAKAAGTVAWYAFEAIKLRIAPRTFLTVDFFVLAPDGILECHDVKGARAIVEEDAKVKMKVAAAAFPFVFRIVIPRPLRDGGGWSIETVGRS